MKRQRKRFAAIAITALLGLCVACKNGPTDPSDITDPGPTDPKAGDVITSSLDIELAWIPAGSFTMGSPEDEPERFDNETQHRVTLSTGFYLGVYQVTQAQYKAVMESNPSSFSAGAADGENQDKRPVEQVSWYDAIEFCNALSVREGLSPAYTIDKDNKDPNNSNIDAHDLYRWTVTINPGSTGYRLPTEAQWEYACRAGSTTAFNNGNNPDLAGAVAWFSENSGNKTHEVGKKEPNAWGLYDMHGNVWEWCWDWFAAYSTGSQTDPAGSVAGAHRVTRGGAWIYGRRHLRSAKRDSPKPSGRFTDIGFRLLRP